MTYRWEAYAFKWEGHCDICSEWTYSGVCAVGKMRWTHLAAMTKRERAEIGMP